MKLKYLQYCFLALTSIVSVTVHASSASIDLSEGMSLNIESGDYFQQAVYRISYPGSDAWLENGDYHVTDKMPACLIVTASDLSSDQLQKFIDDLDVTTKYDRELPLETYKGTLTYVDKDPFNSSFGDTPYTIKTKNNLSFGQLLQYVGGTQSSRVFIFFNRGCAELATRAYLPEKNADILKTANAKLRRDIK